MAAPSDLLGDGEAERVAIERRHLVHVLDEEPHRADTGSGREGGRQHVGLLRAHRMCVEADRRLHRDQRQQLEQMVRHHVAQRAGCVIETAAVADAELFVDGDLDMVDVITIPDRLE